MGGMTDQAAYIDRRRRFAEAIGDALAIIPAAREVARNADTHYEFRQDSDFFFLTGFDEPDAVAVFNPAHDKERYVLFVRPRDREMEIWNGHRAGVEGAVATYGAEVAYPAAELAETDSAKARAAVEEMCRKLLANTVIENYRVEVEG